MRVSYGVLGSPAAGHCTLSASVQVAPGQAHSIPSVAKATSFPCLHEVHPRGGGGHRDLIGGAGGGAEPCKGA